MAVQIVVCHCAALLGNSLLLACCCQHTNAVCWCSGTRQGKIGTRGALFESGKQFGRDWEGIEGTGNTASESTPLDVVLLLCFPAIHSIFWRYGEDEEAEVTRCRHSRHSSQPDERETFVPLSDYISSHALYLPLNCRAPISISTPCVLCQFPGTALQLHWQITITPLHTCHRARG